MKKLFIAGMASLVLAGCGSDSNDQTTGQVSLGMSDAPVDGLKNVCVAFNKITVHHSGGSETSWGTTSFAADQSSASCIPNGLSIPLDLNGNPEFMVINLLDYQGSNALQVLSDEVLLAGKYTQMRLSVLEKGSYTDGTPYSHVVTDTDAVEGIRVPSGELKLDGFTVEADATQAYTIEFDLRKSMVLNANGYQLKPRGVRVVENTSVATISGKVDAANCSSDLSNAFVYLYPLSNGGQFGDLGSENEPLTSAAVDQTTGQYAIGYLPLDTYDLNLVCNGNEDDPEQAGDTLIVDQTILDQILGTDGLTVNF
ncbi:DUF4382 domain-containing protein [Photobacterium galatheae]|uniref:DUF4382 domain-containing protein n=1 Tax=Photobacterium galatheae TaxID=1654360 RepID=A0A066RWI1_9GAMM|nr:DUF4382 domain-containing protein [Photobacterium galatheae]KDM91733.1 hypothetical protein EA58_10210 [Photobacterium galatheae]MCM0149843.1 DUF4382 domain-containing protein [Photobacterium galatheae]